MLLTCRTLQFLVGLSLGALSLFFIGPEMRRADASVSPLLQIAGVALVAAAYFTVGWLAARDVQRSSVVAIVLALTSTPVFVFLWLMGQWSMPSSEASKPLFYYVGGNAVMFFSGLVALIRIAWTRRRSTSSGSSGATGQG